MFCKKCGAELPDGARFCKKCGAQTNIEAVHNSDSYAYIKDNRISRSSKKYFYVAAAVLLAVVFLGLGIFFTLKIIESRKESIATAEDVSAKQKYSEALPENEETSGNTEAFSEENTEPENIEKETEKTFDTEEFEGWETACRVFLEDEGYLLTDEEYFTEPDEYGYDYEPIAYALYDFEGDRLPEIIINNGEESYAGNVNYVYKYKDGGFSYIDMLPGSSYTFRYDENNDSYRGLFVDGAHTGAYWTDYYELSGDGLEVENVRTSEEEYDQKNDKYTVKETYKTTDNELGRADGKAVYSLEFVAEGDFFKMGWDSFLKSYGIESKSTGYAAPSAPVYEPLTEQSSVKDVEQYAEIIEGVHDTTNSGSYNGVGTNNFYRIYLGDDVYRDELIKTVISTGNSELDELMKHYGYSDYSLEFYYDNPDYSEEKLSMGPLLIEARIDGNEYKYYFIKNNLIKRAAPDGETFNPKTNDFLAQLYKFGFAYRWKFNLGDMDFSHLLDSSELTGDIQYAANIFLSNFAEQNFNNYSSDRIDVDQLMNFAHLYAKINKNSVISYEEKDGKYFEVISLNDINSIINRYFTVSLSDTDCRKYKDSEYSFYNDKKLYYEAADGEAYNRMAIVEEIKAVSDGKYQMTFSVFDLDLDKYFEYNGVDKSYYKLTLDEVRDNKDLKIQSSGEAIVIPYKYSGNDSYKLVEYTSNMQ